MPGRTARHALPIALPFALILGAAAPATAANAPAGAKADPDAKSCKYVQYVGSRIPKRECRTNAEWAELQKVQAEETAQARRAGASSCGEGSRGC